MDFNKKYLKYKSKYFKLKNKNKIKDLINSKRIKVIVARYNEDISWLNKIKDFVILYNKGKDDLKDWNAIKLKNVGRETDTYLNYIIENYNNLPEICIFTQGNIKDHYYGGYKYLLKLGVEALNNGISKPQKNSLIVDDVYETGITLNSLRHIEGASFFVLFSKRKAEWWDTLYFCEQNEWIVFPWENKEKSLNDQKEYLMKRELP